MVNDFLSQAEVEALLRCFMGPPQPEPPIQPEPLTQGVSMNFEQQIKQLVKNASAIENYSVGELAMQMASRLQPGTQVRVTNKGVRVTHSRYLDRLSSADQVDDAINMCDFAKVGVGGAMTLNEAIEHAEQKSNNSHCGGEHRQLADWLIELKLIRGQRDELVDVLHIAKNGLVQWHVPDNRYAALTLEEITRLALESGFIQRDNCFLGGNLEVFANKAAELGIEKWLRIDE